MSIRSGLRAICMVSLLLGASKTFAQDPMRDTGGGPARVFGDVGQIAVSSDTALVIQHSTHDVSSISFAPAADYFLVRNLSLGGTLLFQYESAGDSSATRFGIGPRLGYNLAFTDMVGLWPKLGFSYSHTSRTLTVPVGSNSAFSRSQSGDAFTLNLFVPVMFHPVQHFFVGFGPFLDTDLSGDDKITTFGGKLTLGGWFET